MAGADSDLTLVAPVVLVRAVDIDSGDDETVAGVMLQMGSAAVRFELKVAN